MSLVRLRPEAPWCWNTGAIRGRSSSGRARPCQGRGSEFEPRRPLQKETPSVRMVFLFGMSRAGLNLLPRPARSALNQEVRQGSCEWLCHSWDAGSESSLVARSKKERHPCGCLSFLEQHFCYAKVVACGRVIEREWGNPQRFPPHTPPSLRYARVRTTKPEGNHKKKHHPSGWCFLFGMSRAGLNLLPRPARSALNPSAMRAPRAGICS